MGALPSRLEPRLSLALAGAFLGLLLLSLGANRLIDVDELTHARVALEAWRDGHWMPLTLDGRPWWDKPPLWPWLAALSMHAFGPEEVAVRLWPALAGAAAVYYLARLAMQRAGAWPGALAALVVAGQLDFVFHARFFSMDTALAAALLGSLWHLQLAQQAGEAGEGKRQLARAGLWLAFGAAVKSYFAIAFLPAMGLALAWRRPGWTTPAKAWLRLACWPAGVIMIWLAGYAAAYGGSFLVQEWRHNLWGRAAGNVNFDAGIPNLAFYYWHARESLGALLVVAMGLWLRQARHFKQAGLAEAFGLIQAPLWLAGLLLVRTQNLNYMLPLALSLGLLLPGWLAGGLYIWKDAAWLAWAGLLAWLCPNWDWAIATGILSAPLLLLGGQGKPGRPRLALAGAALLAAAAWKGSLLYLRRPPDPNRGIAAALLAHPAQVPGEPLLYAGPSTQAPQFYSRYQVQSLPQAPAGPPQGKRLVVGQGGQVQFFEPKGN